jgi:uncharacterized protein (DUF1697 family)
MQRYVAFLRGMNLGKRRIKNEELREAFEALELAEVACFRASGNVVFAAEGSEEGALAQRIETGLDERLGYAVPVFLRNAAALRKIAAQEPFDAAQLSASKGKPQVAFLPTAAKGAARKQAIDMATDEDRLTIAGRELYWLPSGGISESELDLKALEATLGPWTMRTKGTVDQIAAKHFAQ